MAGPWIGLALPAGTSARPWENLSMIARTAGPAVAAPPVRTRVFPAAPAQAREARRFLAGILTDSPVADDAITCLSELATNAIVHSRSRQAAGNFTVRAEIRVGGGLRVEVQDQGGAWTAHPAAPDASEGRGLTIVASLTSDWGRTGDIQDGWTVWFEMNCP